jgi:hypothetical protein
MPERGNHRQGGHQGQQRDARQERELGA